MRVYEIAKEVGIPNKDLIAKIRALGLEVNNHMSSLDADDVARIKRSLEKEKQSVAQPQQTQRLATGGAVLRRRSGERPSEGAGEERSTEREPVRARTPHAEPERSAPAPAPAAPSTVIRRRVAAEESPAAPSGATSSVQRPVVRASAAAPSQAAAVEVAEATRAVEARPAEPRAESRPESKAERAERPEVPERVERVERAAQAEPAQPERSAAAQAPQPSQSAAPAGEARERADASAARAEAPAAERPAERPIERVSERMIERPAEPAPRVAERANRATTQERAEAPRTERPERPHAGAVERPDRTGAERPAAVHVRSGERATSVEAGRRSGAAEAPIAAQSDRPRSRVIVAGPQVVGRGGESAQTQARAPERASTPPPSTPLPPRVVSPRTPQIEHKRPEPVVDARSRFELELERARARTAEREPTRGEDGPADNGEHIPSRDPSRPAVGTVIALPPRIKITERTPATGRPPPGPQPVNPIRGRFAQQQQQRGSQRPAGGRPASTTTSAARSCPSARRASRPRSPRPPSTSA